MKYALLIYDVPGNYDQLSDSDREAVSGEYFAISDEPGVYIRGEFGVRLEDDMHITSDGAQLFTRPSTSLDQPF